MENFCLDCKVKKSNTENLVFERDAWDSGRLVCGIDEVGRGCLAGPVVAAAVILRPGMTDVRVRDSKEMTSSERNLAVEWIVRSGWYGIGYVNSFGVDQYGIVNATMRAMRLALSQAIVSAGSLPERILVDAVPLRLQGEVLRNIPVVFRPRGEQWSMSIAAASIVAKVYRDQLMNRFDGLTPGYSFAEHKGYGTGQHCSALLECSDSLIHRQSFLKTIHHNIMEQRHGRQKELFG
jgi:ribonuclease HII